MRSLHLAICAYVVDTNRIPHQPDLVDSLAQRVALNSVTTPIAYMSSVPADPFHRVATDLDPVLRYPYFVNLTQIGAIPPDAQEFNKYVLGSIGPDGVQDTAEALFDLWGNGWNQIEARGIYDPTNGTISAGDVVRTACSERGGSS
jgi:hypothetical protein